MTKAAEGDMAVLDEMNGAMLTNIQAKKNPQLDAAGFI
jgi:hypothetical protein